MLLPSFFSNNYIDNFFNDDFYDVFKPSRINNGIKLMNADVKEYEDHYDMKLDLPGFNKEDIKVNLKDGNLIIEAKHNELKEEKDDKDGKYIRRERYVGKVKRSFYLGENVKEEDIYARFNNGILELNIPKVKPSHKSIDIN